MYVFVTLNVRDTFMSGLIFSCLACENCCKAKRFDKSNGKEKNCKKEKNKDLCFLKGESEGVSEREEKEFASQKNSRNLRKSLLA